MPTKLKRRGPMLDLQHYEVILKLKRTASIETAMPHTWREIAKKVGSHHVSIHRVCKKMIGNHDDPRCPSCLQRIEKAKK